MIVDIFYKILQKDPFLKRNMVKTVSWRIVGSLDTVVLGWVVTGQFITGAQIGLGEFFTKMFLYYLHERLWQNVTFGVPSKRSQAKIIQNEIQPHLFKQVGKINRSHRENLNNNKSFTIWLTGLSGAGKSTLASEIEVWIHSKRGQIYILDGDNTRLGINSDLSFSDDDRAENIRRVAEICRLFNDAGVTVIASFISPFENDRKLAKNLIGAESFIEVYVDAHISICQQRDPKGLYKLAFEGKIKNFTGIDSPYHPPNTPDIHINTDVSSLEESVDIVKQYLKIKGFLNKSFYV